MTPRTATIRCLASCVIALLCGCYPEPSDRDDDGVPDQRDNCPDVANPDQRDTLRSGTGDACRCEERPDRDRDCVPDRIDNCPDVANPDQLDSRRDGVGDLCRCASVQCADLPGPCFAGNRCDPATGRCVLAVLADGSRCEDGDPCSDDDRCLGGTCYGQGQTVCPEGTMCNYGVCDRSAGCTFHPAPSQTPCDDGIRDTDFDRCDGAGRCVGMCSRNLVLCGVTCVDIQTSVAHCGRCENACLDTQTCRSGVCEVIGCRSDQLICAGVCAAVLTDPSNCGRCGNQCPIGQTCQSGACAAP